MKIPLLTLISLFSISAISAQENAIAKIQYHFKHVNDSTQRENFLQDEVVTILGTHSSLYRSYSSDKMQQQIMKMQQDPGFDGNLNIVRSSSPIATQYLLDQEKQELLEITRIGREEFQVKMDFPKQDWELHDEHKDIGGYTCQKATCSFKGRNYTAWFTIELPFSYGPWKLNGLPGLILSAEDEKQDVVFEYVGFDKTSTDVVESISASANSIVSTPAEIQKLQKAFQDNPQAFLQAQNNKVSGSGAVKTITVGGKPSGNVAIGNIKSVNIRNADNYKPSKNSNNPIELKP